MRCRPSVFPHIGCLWLPFCMATAMAAEMPDPGRTDKERMDFAERDIFGSLEDVWRSENSWQEPGYLAIPEDPAMWRYRRTAFLRAAEILHGKQPENFAAPVPYSAVLREFRNGRKIFWSFLVFWFEDRFQSAGVYLLDDEGKNLADVFWRPWTEADKKEEVKSVERNVRFQFPPIVVRSNPDDEIFDDVVKEAIQSGSSLPALDVSLDTLRRLKKVGLVLKDGTRTEPIDAYVDRRIRLRLSQEHSRLSFDPQKQVWIYREPPPSGSGEGKPTCPLRPADDGLVSAKHCLTSRLEAYWGKRNSLAEPEGISWPRTPAERLLPDDPLYREYLPAQWLRAVGIIDRRNNADGFRKPVPYLACFYQDESDYPILRWYAVRANEALSQGEEGRAFSARLRREDTGDWTKPFVQVVWLEQGWDSTGIYLADENNETLATFRWAEWTDADRVFLARRGMTRCLPYVRLFVGDEVKCEGANKGVLDVAAVHLTPDILRRLKKVGIVMKDGTRSDSVDAYVAPSLFGKERP